MTTYFHLLQRLRNYGDTPPFSHKPSWHREGQLYKGNHTFHTLNYPEPFSCIHTKQINYQTHVLYLSDTKGKQKYSGPEK